MINNLCIRRAVEELKVANLMSQVRSILLAAFQSNHFDAFDLQPSLAVAGHSQAPDPPKPFHWTGFPWTKIPHLTALSGASAWKISLDLLTTSNLRCGTLTVYRAYDDHDLQLDINLLISVFPVALADALHRVAESSPMLIPVPPDHAAAIAVNQ